MIEKFPTPFREQGNEEDIAKRRQELLDTGKVVEFREPEKLELAEIPENAPFVTKTGLDVIDRFLTYPTMIDTFTSHDERTKWWREQLPSNLKETFITNTLTRNNAGGALNAADFVIEDSGDALSAFKKQRDELYDAFVAGWERDAEHPDGHISKDKKVQFIETKLKPFLIEVRATAIEELKKR